MVKKFHKDKNLEYWIREDSIHIVNDEYFQKKIKNNDEYAWEVIQEIKKQFRKEFGREFEVTDRSLVVEVYGHIYPDKIADFFPEGIGNIIQNRTEVIDCGEMGYDKDRIIWDTIARVWEKSIVDPREKGSEE